MTDNDAKKNWFASHKILTVILCVVLLFIVIGVIGSRGNKPSTASKTTTTSSKPSSALAKNVESAYLKQIGYGSITELNQDKNGVVGKPGSEITAFQDENDDSVRVIVQDSITKEQAQLIGKTVFAAASDVKGLNWIIVRGTDGLDVNVSRSDAGLAS